MLTMKIKEELEQKKAAYEEVMNYLIKHTERPSSFYDPICDYVDELKLRCLNLEYEIELLHDYRTEPNED